MQNSHTAKIPGTWYVYMYLVCTLIIMKMHAHVLMYVYIVCCKIYLLCSIWIYVANIQAQRWCLCINFCSCMYRYSYTVLVHTINTCNVKFTIHRQYCHTCIYAYTYTYHTPGFLCEVLICANTVGSDILIVQTFVSCS